MATIFFPVWLEIVYFLSQQQDEVSMTKISKKLDITFSHIQKNLYELRDRKIISIIKKGRTRNVKLLNTEIIQAICVVKQYFPTKRNNNK
jgi:predicted transcriptional regulator